MPMLKLYAFFCACQPQLKDKLGQLRNENEEFEKFLQVNEAKPECRHLQLEDFLIMPMQRITRYPLLLHSLREKTPEDVRCPISISHPQNPDHKQIVLALERIKAIVYLVNERTGKAEVLYKVQRVQNRFHKKHKEVRLKNDLFKNK